MDDELYHYGVKGMKWGIRKARYHKRRAEANEAKRRAANTYARANKRVSELYPRLGGLNKLSSKYYRWAAKKYQKRAETHIKQYLKNKMDAMATASNVEAGKRYIEQISSMRIDSDRIDRLTLLRGVYVD